MGFIQTAMKKEKAHLPASDLRTVHTHIERIFSLLHALIDLKKWNFLHIYFFLI